MPRKAKEKTEEGKEEKKLSQLEYEKRVLELAEKGLTSEKIGQLLKNEKIHSSEYPKKISIILKDKKKYTNPDLKNIEAKLTKLQQHNSKHKHDRKAIRDKERIASQFRKLKGYFAKKEKIVA